MATSYQEAVEKTIIASEQLNQIVNGTATAEVVVEDGSKIPSVRKALVDNFYFKDPLPWQQGQSETVFNQLRKFSDGTLWYAPTATASNVIPMGATPIGDPLWKVYSLDAIPKLTPQIRESLRRSYAAAGLTLVTGSFEDGGTLSGPNDVLLQSTSGKAFSGPTGAVPAGTNPASGGFTDQSLSELATIALGTSIRRALTARFAEVINPKDYGAKGVGTDDTDAFKKAIAYMSGEYPASVKWEHRDGNFRQELYIPQGEYLISDTLEFYKCQGFVINGVGKLRVQGNGMNKPLVHFNECLWFYVNDIYFQNGSVDYKNLPNDDRTAIKLTECYIAKFDSIRIFGANTGIHQLQGNGIQYNAISIRYCRNAFLGYKSGNNTGNSMIDPCIEWCEKGIYLDNNISYFGIFNLRGGYFEHVNQCIRVHNKQDIKISGAYAALSEEGDVFIKATGTNTSSDIEVEHVNIANNSKKKVFFIDADDGITVKYQGVALAADDNGMVYIRGNCIINRSARKFNVVRSGDFYGYTPSTLTTTSLPWRKAYNGTTVQIDAPVSGYNGNSLSADSSCYQDIIVPSKSCFLVTVSSKYGTKIDIEDNSNPSNPVKIGAIENWDTSPDVTKLKAYVMYTAGFTKLRINLRGGALGSSGLSFLQIEDMTNPIPAKVNIDDTIPFSLTYQGVSPIVL